MWWGEEICIGGEREEGKMRGRQREREIEKKGKETEGDNERERERERERDLRLSNTLTKLCESESPRSW